MMTPLSPLAEELNLKLQESHQTLFEVLSAYGKRLFFPKGIISQSGEAKEKASRFNATIGIAKEDGHAMMLPSFEDLVHLKAPAHKVLPYAPSQGLPELRKLWSERQRAENPSLETTSLPLVTSGLTHGLSLAGELFLNPGDPVVLPSLFWGNYKLMWQVRGEAQFITYPFFDEKLEKFNQAGFEKALEKVKGDKVFVPLNLPHNPTGYSLTLEESQALCESLKRLAQSGKKIITLCDDAYFGLTFEEGLKRESLFSDLAKLHENILAIKVDGCTKELFLWGLRVGFLTFGSKGADPEALKALEQKAAAALRGGISNVTHHSQELVKELFENPKVKDESLAKSKVIEARYKAVKREVYKKEYQSFWDVYPFNSGYFMCVRLKNQVNAEKLRKHLLDEYQTGVISLGETDLRIAFSCVEEEHIEELFSTLAKACETV